MGRALAWFVHVSVALVAVTGLVYAWMRYLAEPSDPFAVVNHPWQPHVQAAHVLAAPLSLFAVALIWRDHVWARFRSGFRAHRRSGLTLLVSLAPMAASGYLLQVSVDETWRQVWIVVHVATSLAWVAVYPWHPLVRRRRRRGGPGEPPARSA